MSSGGLQTPVSQSTVRGAEAEASSEIEAENPVDLIVAPLEPVLTNSDTEAHFNVQLENLGERSLPDGSVQLTIGDRIISGSVTLSPETDEAAAIHTDDGPLTPESTVIATEAVSATAGETLQEISITVQAEDLPFDATTDAGVYPLYATYVPANTAADASITAFSPMVWKGVNEPSAAVDLTLVVPFMFPEDVLSMPTRGQLSDAAPGFEALLDYAEEVQAVIAIDPRILAAIRGYGAEAPEPAIEFLDRLERSALTSFLLQYGDADPAAQSALGSASLLEPTGLEFVTRFGDWPLSVEDDITPDSEFDTEVLDPVDYADPVTGEPTLPALGSWPNGVPGAWPAGGQASVDTLALMRSHGLDLAVLNSDNVNLRGGPSATVNDEQAIITDAELDAAVALTLQDSTDSARALGIARATARLVMAADIAAADKPSNGLVLGVDRGGITSGESPEELLRQLTDLSFVDTINIDSQETGTATLRDLEPSEERTLLLQSALENEAYVLEARSLLVNPEFLDSYQRMRLLTLFGTRYAAEETDFLPVSKGFAKRDSELHDGVELVGTKRAQLVGGSTRIPVQLRNSLPFDVIVNVTVSPRSAALSVPERQFLGVELPDDSSDRVLVPVEARVSSGESALLLSVTSADGEFAASTDVLPVSISTTVETIAISVLAFAALLLFTFGIWRSVRRRSLRTANKE